MTFGPSGQTDSYTPPTESGEGGGGKKARSPWFYVGIGCGTLFLLSFAGCVGVTLMLAPELNKPVDARQTVESLRVTPYPGSKVDEAATRGARAVGVTFKRFLKADTAFAGGFRTDDLSGEVIAFYDKEMTKQGYLRVKQLERVDQRVYVHDRTRVMVMIQVRDAQDDDTARLIIINRFEGVRVETLQDSDLKGDPVPVTEPSQSAKPSPQPAPQRS